MKFAILTKPGHGSPWVLAHSLKDQFKECGIVAEISTEINALNRLVSLKNNTLHFHFWLWEKLHNYFADRKTLKWLKNADAVVICDCIPNGFWKRLYNVEKLKKITGKPVLFYEVFYLGNAPTQIQKLQKNGDPLLERYDAHLFVSNVTETKTLPPGNAFCIGLDTGSWNLVPMPKKELVALVDFAQPGYEKYREVQIAQLKKAGVRYISLEKRYSLNEIRDIYRDASVYFMQSFEAFGLPILECLCTGTQIFTPHSSWPMSWRLDDKPQVHGDGTLPSCFTVYEDEEGLAQKLEEFKKNYHPSETPQKVFDSFIKHYPTFYDGNKKAIKGVADFILSFKCNKYAV
ncbi:MAG: hypothetical protein ACTHJN_12630 [Ginsengibacter sp.]